MASRNLNARQPAKNIGASPPTRKTMVNGVPVTEKVSPLWGYKMVAPDGDVTFVTLSTGFTIRGLKGNDHGFQKLAEKEKAGFWKFSECPVATRKLSVAEAGSPACEGEFSDEKCCPHMTKVINDRRAAYRATQVDYAKNFETQTDRLLAHIQKQASDSVAERPGSQPGKKAPIGG
jgi:hypothetical protein